MVALRIATANLQMGIGVTRGYWQYLTRGIKYYVAHGSAPVERAAEAFAEGGVDILASVEVSGGGTFTRGVNQAELLARASGLHHFAYFPAFVRGGRVNQGNAVHSRYPVRAVQSHTLPGTGQPRVLAEAAVELPDGEITVLVTHLSLQLDVREGQLARIAQIIGSHAGPVVLAGDFNIKRHTELELLERTALVRTASGPTFPSWKPQAHLDHLFFTEHFGVRNVQAFSETLFADHLPLIADVELTQYAA